MTDQNPIEDRVTEDMPVAPPETSDADTANEAQGSCHKDAGTDESIAERLKRNPESKQARLDNALDESMDASDPPATTQPVHANDPVPSSGYDADKEARKQQ